ncbi:MAG: type II toxin-antitoxin system death-on-curing family toxin [Patescibacteria group bacterium]|nr:type II toxin-antitoxin system death-on-curing family toxin [Patescibacteria group bacterium]
MKLLSLQEVEYVAFKIAQAVMTKNEPIPDFSSRFEGVLESCLAAPFQKYGGQYVYSGLTAKAANLFYLMVKNHPFENGNKRIAITTLMVFLASNNKWLEVDQKEFYNFAVWVASSPATLKDEVVQGVEKFLKKYLVSL